MEIGEAVGILTAELAADEYCGNKVVKQSGKAIIDGIKGGVGSADTLRDNMLGARIEEPGKPKQLTKGWNLFDCSGDVFPYQSHHLVPEKQLPKHAVTVWLTDSPKQQHPDYVLEADTNYDTNGAENGYFLPFASTTHQWAATSSPSRRDNICFEMMRRTRLQLHQGPHSSRDYVEEAEIETAGYKTMVNKLLTMIYGRGEQHVKICKKCKKEASPKIKVQPLDASVEQVNFVSIILQTLIQSQRIFVSKRSADYFKKTHVGGDIFASSQPFVTDTDS